MEYQVSYDSEHAAFAKKYRDANAGYPELFGDIRGRNVASLIYDDKSSNTRKSITQMSESGHGVLTRHAEECLIQAYETEVGENGIVLEIYSELQCCGVGYGMRNCRGKVLKFLEKYGRDGRDTPVYFSFPYPPNDRSARRESVEKMRTFRKA